MPQLYPVNANTMNYAGPIMGGVVLVSGIWYLVYGVSPRLILLPLLFTCFPILYLSFASDYQWRTYKPAAAVVGGFIRSPDDVAGAIQSGDATDKSSWDGEEKNADQKQ